MNPGESRDKDIGLQPTRNTNAWNQHIRCPGRFVTVCYGLLEPLITAAFAYIIILPDAFGPEQQSDEWLEGNRHTFFDSEGRCVEGPLRITMRCHVPSGSVFIAVTEDPQSLRLAVLNSFDCRPPRPANLKIYEAHLGRAWQLCIKAGIFLRIGKYRERSACSSRLMLFVLIANHALHCRAGKCADVRHCRHRGTNTHALWQNIRSKRGGQRIGT